MKSLKLTLVVSLSLICAMQRGYAQPPVIDESDQYSLAINTHQEPNANSLSKSAEPDEELWQNDPSANNQANKAQAVINNDPQPVINNDPQPLVNTKISEETDGDSDSVADQVHNLQAEIQELRGQIEVQAHDLKMLQQQQLAFYKDLDSRLQKQKSEPSKELVSVNTIAPTIKKMSLEPSKRGNPADEQISYLAAYELIKTKQYDKALKAMQQFSETYPNSGYSANTHYWMGELYLVKNDNERALQAFNMVLSKFPKSSKAAASELKASYALVNLGQTEAARSKLTHIINQYPDTKTAQLAKQKLDSMN